METEESLGLKKENAPQKKSWCESTEGRVRLKKKLGGEKEKNE